MFEGTATAIITPFRKDGSVDEEGLRRLVDFQEENGVTTLVPCGSTGESATLSHEEHIKVISIVIDQAKKARVLAGAGSNCTAEALMLSKTAADLGADGILSISPYYNKPTQEGLYRHFSKIADDCGLPVILYNVPGRTGIPIQAETIARLAKNPNVAAVKEAGGSVERVSEILNICDITVMSGDDSLTLPMMSVGAKGVISVASNIYPAELKRFVDLCAAGKFTEALPIHRRFYDLFKHLFIESNPIPVKAAMAMLGMIEEEYRLPLCPMNPKNREILKATIDALK